VPDGEDPPGVGLLAPLVFEAARRGDEVARAILVEVGRDLGLSARVAAQRLFAPGEAFPLVLGGSVLAGNPDSPFATAILDEVRTRFPAAVPTLQDAPPVAGAVLLALDALADGPDGATVAAGLRDTILAAVKGDRHL
jgi:N-acetylglucosamine kinase-like BadF-type ATPase